uniref:Uncharacterized protein n=1 Tax=Pseudonaja textilis TaxID=8673 RepID=A0A670YED4_PSETE
PLPSGLHNLILDFNLHLNTEVRLPRSKRPQPITWGQVKSTTYQTVFLSCYNYYCTNCNLLFYSMYSKFIHIVSSFFPLSYSFTIAIHS